MTGSKRKVSPVGTAQRTAKTARTPTTHSGGKPGPKQAPAAAKPPAKSGAIAQRSQGATWDIDDFEIGRGLGRGKFGNVYLVRLKKQKKVLAMKVVFKDEIEKHQVKHQLIREINIHTRLRHENIVRFYACFQTAERVHIVLEYCNGGDLYGVMQKLPNTRFPEPKAANFIRQLCRALVYTHRKGVIHRDIKPENILLCKDRKTGKETIKIADFGWSVVERVHSARSTLCGTLAYIPPEMVRGSAYDRAVDYWTVGVLLYEFVVGHPPFEAPEDEAKTFEAIENSGIAFPDHVSEGARDIISKLLQKEPTKRMPLSGVFTHPWIVEHCGVDKADEVYTTRADTRKAAGRVPKGIAAGRRAARPAMAMNPIAE